MKSVSAADANRHFSRILREVSYGETVTVTSRGRPVAIIAPISTDLETQATKAKAERTAAWKALLDRLAAQPAMNLGKFNRDELYDDD